MILQNHQANRKLGEGYLPFLQEQFPHSRILITNFGFVIVHNNPEEGVYKIYSDKSRLEKELSNFRFLESGSIVTPKIYEMGSFLLRGERMYYFLMENIRKSSKKFSSVHEISPSDIGILLSRLHALSLDRRNARAYVHGNIHPSNFFHDGKNNLGIFDLIGMFHGSIEYDFALLYIHANYDDIFLNLVLNSYNHRGLFSRKKLYEYTLRILVNKIQMNEPIQQEGVEGLRLALESVKKKYYSET